LTFSCSTIKLFSNIMEKLNDNLDKSKFSTINALRETKVMVKQLSAISQEPMYSIIAKLVEREYSVIVGPWKDSEFAPPNVAKLLDAKKNNE
jgi:hypothetical protein